MNRCVRMMWLGVVVGCGDFDFCDVVGGVCGPSCGGFLHHGYLLCVER